MAVALVQQHFFPCVPSPHQACVCDCVPATCQSLCSKVDSWACFVCAAAPGYLARAAGVGQRALCVEASASAVGRQTGRSGIKVWAAGCWLAAAAQHDKHLSPGPPCETDAMTDKVDCIDCACIWLPGTQAWCGDDVPCTQHMPTSACVRPVGCVCSDHAGISQGCLPLKRPSAHTCGCCLCVCRGVPCPTAQRPPCELAALCVPRRPCPS